ncbi:hypothetical protein PTKIN_Ptkin14bG0027800 [Pterospermum kingtungense]
MPATIRNRIEKLQRRFLWGDSEARKRIHWVNWNTVCLPKDLGGLGVGNLEVRNKALFAKWIWRFSNEEDAVWRRLLIEKYGGEQHSLTLALHSHRSFSTLWKNITYPLTHVDSFSDTLLAGMGYSVGDGSRILFWHHEWIQGKILKFSFPRIFALACLKNGVIKDYGCFVEGIWRWEIDLGRSLFRWEWQQWNDLLSCLNKFQVCDFLRDVLIWKSSPSGNFTPKACCRDYGRNVTISVHPWAKIWSGFLPPKVEVFC